MIFQRKKTSMICEFYKKDFLKKLQIKFNLVE